MADVVGAVAELVSGGRVRAWGIVNWPADRVAEAGRVARELGVAPPCAAQLPYSLISRDWVESAEMTAALRACGAKVVASYVLAGGILSGKYASGAGGRMAGEVDAPRWESAVRAAGELQALAEDAGTTPATLAYAFALLNADVATVLFGATSPEQIRENVAAADVAAALTESQLARLARSLIGACTPIGIASATRDRAACPHRARGAPGVDAALTVVTSASASSAMVRAPATNVGRSSV